MTHRWRNEAFTTKTAFNISPVYSNCHCLTHGSEEGSETLGSARLDHDPDVRGGLITSLQPLRIHSDPSHPPRAPTLQECEVIIRQLYNANSLQSQEVSAPTQPLGIRKLHTIFMLFIELSVEIMTWVYDSFRLFVWRRCWEILFWARKSPQKTTFSPRPTLLMVPGKVITYITFSYLCQYTVKENSTVV